MAGSISQEQWITLLSEFGPCAFFVFMFFVGLRIASMNKGLSPEQQRSQNIAYSVVWLSIFVFAGLSIVVFWKSNFSDQCIHGYIRGLDDPEVISTRDNIFLKKSYGASTDFDYEFRIINPNAEARSVALQLQKDPNGLHALTFKIPLAPDFNRKGKIPVEIAYDRSSDCLIVNHSTGKPETLHPEVQEAVVPAHVGEALHFGFLEKLWSLPVVSAAILPPDPDSLIRALDANDPVIRENARRQLLANGTASVTVLQNALANGSNSTRLKFESVRTLNAMGGVNGASFPQAARCAAVQLSRNPDALVRAEAGRLLGRVGGGRRC